jgi:hypothetical protein
VSDWKDRIADALTPTKRNEETTSTPGPGELTNGFEALAAGLREALEYLGERLGLSLNAHVDECGARLRWQYLTHSLMLRMEHGDRRFVLSVTTDRDYEHVELWIEAGRLVAYQNDQQSEADLPALVQAFVTRFLLDSPKETPRS